MNSFMSPSAAALIEGLIGGKQSWIEGQRREYELQNHAAHQRTAEANMQSLLNFVARQPETKESRAQRMAKEIRENKPSMQVQRRTRREA